MATDPSTLPQFDGRPVPWVTRWSGEVHPDRYKYGVQMSQGKLVLCYEDRKENRDGTGVLWQREGLTRKGRPDWASVNTYRQRSAMQKRRCQVCGNKITETPIRWLMPIDGLEQVDEDTTITMQPPTCSECIPTALDLCPNLVRQGYMILKVIDYSMWGVFGHVVTMTEGGPRKFQTAVSYDTSKYGPEFSLTQVMAQQQVVQLGKFVVETKVEGKAPRPRHPYLPEMLEAMSRQYGVPANEIQNALAEQYRKETQEA